jgi:hypothetical protein
VQCHANLTETGLTRGLECLWSLSGHSHLAFSKPWLSFLALLRASLATLLSIQPTCCFESYLA